MSKVRYYVLRTLQTVFMLWLAATLLFILFRSMPGDFTDRMLFAGADPAAVEAFREDWGLNDPLYVQYYRYITNLAVGNAGVSLEYRVPVIQYIRMRLFNSFILIAPGITFAYLLGSLYGLLAGMKRGSIIEKYGIIPIIFLGAFPSFVTAIFLIVIFASWLGWFPTGGLITADTRRLFADAPWWRRYLTGDFLWHAALPFTAVVCRYLFLPSLIMRTSVFEVQGQGFIFYNRITGLPAVNRLRHIAKHASLPVITLYPVSMTRAIGGLVLIEIVFNWPGIGAALVDGVLARDYPVVQFVFFLIAAFIIIANYAVDIIYGIIDPRIAVEGE